MCLSTVLFPRREFGFVGSISICPHTSTHTENNNNNTILGKTNTGFVLCLVSMLIWSEIHKHKLWSLWCCSRLVTWCKVKERSLDGRNGNKGKTSQNLQKVIWKTPLSLTHCLFRDQLKGHTCNETCSFPLPGEPAFSPCAYSLRSFPDRSFYLLVVSKLGWKRMGERLESA